ncbi:hypothetical protein PAXINDRAFT_15784 [Paxillus involutus ATCC 200175]|uniref:Uncharacterized protein n=1 Tax=Paxillus involutus ATCC 200175 TaxID=664439 RepID=A0A0C9TU29_PAXIN|nr:hypothetical protein PAXINDRAFT_15784 [Paxillus involutus ATCC 200175]
MDAYKEDQFAAERQQNPHYPFASADEWGFASWLLCSQLSLAAIDLLLSLNLVTEANSTLISYWEAAQITSRGATLWAALVMHTNDTPASYQMTYATVCNKTSLHAYLLLALLPICKFVHKESRVQSLLQDCLLHQALDVVLSPLKVAASVGIMMNDPVGNLHYCFIPLASWIADTPEESLLSVTSPKVSHVTTATSKQFGDNFRHPSRTGELTLTAINTVCAQYPPSDFKPFLKAIKQFGLNGVIEPFWKGWALSDPSEFLTPEPLHHFHHMFWDHDVKWCIAAVGATELDFCFSVLQVAVGYCGFLEGILKLKQVTGHDHCAVQHYIVGVIAGAVPPNFLIAICTLTDFRYLAQATSFTDESIGKVAGVLQEFHDHKKAILCAEAWMGKNGPILSWNIPKLELLQSIVPSI